MIKVILEGRDAPLYHCTSLDNAYQILTKNVFLASKPRDEDVKVVCFTRNKNYWIWNSVVRFTIDQRKLNQNHKIKPHNYKNIKLDTMGINRISDPQFEAEERVYSDVKNARKCITEIEINPLVCNELLAYGEDSPMIRAILTADKDNPHPMDAYDNSAMFVEIIQLSRKYSIPLGKNYQKLAKALNGGV